MFRDRGAAVVDADAIARSLLAPGAPVANTVMRAFPECIEASDGAVIDRRLLASRIFHDEGARRLLESITHPPIIAELTSQIQKYRDSDVHGLVAAEIPLLFEANLQTLVDRVLVVTCDDSLQTERLMARLSLDETEARRQIASQLPLAEKEARADYLIKTDTGLGDTEQQVAALALLLGF